jgi:putative oxygen-independent coproporphyrinogen III oxidase
MSFSSLSLYIHIPWCIKKCPYCDFNSHAVKNTLPEFIYIDTLLKDLSNDIDLYNLYEKKLHSIFIGGGTPSLFSAEAFFRLFTGIKQQLAFSENIEITLEANPGTFEIEKFAEFQQLGINRLSIGIQSFNDAMLKKLGRIHSANEAIRAIEMAHHVGFTNINIDLMYGLPNATRQTNRYDIETAIKLKPTHISYYQLTFEPNTLFYKYPPSVPTDDHIFTMQCDAQTLLASAGYQQYEISAYSQEDKQCRHNVNYWQFGDYLGIGAGAHGKISVERPDKIIRTMKPKHPEHYEHNLYQKSLTQSISNQELPIEFLMNHLRLKEGFTLQQYAQTTGLTSDTLEPALSTCVNDGLLLFAQKSYFCSKKGWDFLDNILERFI